MKIYTFKLTKKHIVAAVLLAAAVLAAIILLAPGGQSAPTGAAVTVKSQEDCVQYLNSLGYQLEEGSAQTKKVQIPKEFDQVYQSYNQMQQQCGYDLQNYAGKKVELTTFQVTNDPSGEEVLLDVLVYKNKIIGGAVYTRSVDGFMRGLTPMEGQAAGTGE